MVQEILDQCITCLGQLITYKKETMKFKYISLFALLIGFLSCEDVESPIPEEVVLPELTTGDKGALIYNMLIFICACNY